MRVSDSQDNKEVTEQREAAGELSILILAAGSSSRLGQSKQLLPLNGEPLLRKITKEAVATGVQNIVVVLGFNANPHTTILKNLPVEVLIHDDWSKGMGSSLKAGVQHVMKYNPKGIVISVCDQPFLSTSHLLKLIAEFNRGHLVIASQYADTVGVPCIFGHPYFPDLLVLPDHVGAKIILHRLSKHVATIPFAQGEIDLDTPEDLKKIKIL